jgi:hypothetical protein
VSEESLPRRARLFAAGFDTPEKHGLLNPPLRVTQQQGNHVPPRNRSPYQSRSKDIPH